MGEEEASKNKTELTIGRRLTSPQTQGHSGQEGRRRHRTGRRKEQEQGAGGAADFDRDDYPNGMRLEL